MVDEGKVLGSICMGINSQVCIDIVNAFLLTLTHEKYFNLENKSFTQGLKIIEKPLC